MTNQFKEIKRNIKIPYFKGSVVALAVILVAIIMEVASVIQTFKISTIGESFSLLVLILLAVAIWYYMNKNFEKAYNESIDIVKKSVLTIKNFPIDKDDRLKFVDTLISESKSESILDVTMGILAWISTTIIAVQSYITVIASNDITATSSAIAVMKKTNDKSELFNNMITKLNSYSKMEAIVPTVLVVVFIMIITIMIIRFMSKNRVVMIALTDLKYDILKGIS